MLYLIVLIASAAGIVLIVSLRMMVQSRRLRSVVSVIQQSTEALEERTNERPATSPLRPRGTVLRKIEGLLREARLALTKKNGGEEAERLLIQALTLDPHSDAAMEELANLYLKTGRELKAEVLFRELLTLKPDSAFYSLLGYACERQGKNTEAVEAYEGALERNPHSPKLQIMLARSLLCCSRVSEAIPLLERSTLRDMHDPELLLLLAECYETLQNRKSARMVYEKLVLLQPQNFAVKEKLAEYALLV